MVFILIRAAVIYLVNQQGFRLLLTVKQSFSNLIKLTSFPVAHNRVVFYQQGAKRIDRDLDGPYGTSHERLHNQ